MSERDDLKAQEEHTHGDHAHIGADGDYVPHVLPYRVYFATWMALLVLTAITVGASYVDFGTGNIVIALAVATIKAATVAALFMHLWFDNKFHTVILTSSLVFLGIFISFTMFDTETRGRTEAVEGDKPAAIQTPFKGTRSEEKIKEAAEEYYEGKKPEPHEYGAAPKVVAVPATMSDAGAAPATAPGGGAAPAIAPDAGAAPGAAPAPSAASSAPRPATK